MKKRGTLFWLLLLAGIVIGFGLFSIIITAILLTPTNTTSVAVQPTATSAPAQNTPSVNTPVATDTPAATATPIPTQALPKWTTTHTFTGNGIKKTAIFTAPDDWKIVWKCNPSSFFGSQYNVQVYVYNSDGSIADVAINELCKSGNTSGETEEHQGGDVYLDINSEGYWVIQVQEFK
jgi:hypothetical protein